MRLIDADTLVQERQRPLWTWQSGTEVAAVLVEDIKAAPTVSCEACAKRGKSVIVCHLCECGSRFERREP
jgi:hypothetical protein